MTVSTDTGFFNFAVFSSKYKTMTKTTEKVETIKSDSEAIKDK